MNEIKELRNLVDHFSKERDWDQFHTPKELAISIVLEASELLECFQWKSEEEIIYCYQNDPYFKKKIEDEISDVFHGILSLSSKLDIDLISAFKRKLDENTEKYPVEKAKGVAKKYTEL